MTTQQCIAFEGTRRIAEGPLAEVARKVKTVLDRGERAPVLLFDSITSTPVEVDFRGSAKDVLARLDRPQMPDAADIEPPARDAQRGPGRPKLGVVAREVTLLPRHWDWLGAQPGGASVALRRLVEEARKTNAGTDRIRAAREAAYRFMSTMAGNLPQFEEAARALFAGDGAKLRTVIAAWPKDVRDHTAALAEHGT